MADARGRASGGGSGGGGAGSKGAAGTQCDGVLSCTPDPDGHDRVRSPLDLEESWGDEEEEGA